jgi:hypothetical protein
MSQENVEIVRSIFEAVDRDDWDAAFRDQHPDVEMTTPPGLNAGTYREREEIEGFWQGLITAFEDVAVEPEECFEKRRPGRGLPQDSGAAQGQQRRDRGPEWTPVDDPRRQGRVHAIFPQARGGPRSRRAFGVGASSNTAVQAGDPEDQKHPYGRLQSGRRTILLAHAEGRGFESH